jgi:hypothetical protein
MEVAMSKTKERGELGIPIASGFVPSSASDPPYGWTRASLVDIPMRMNPASA